MIDITIEYKKETRHPFLGESLYLPIVYTEKLKLKPPRVTGQLSQPKIIIHLDT